METKDLESLNTELLATFGWRIEVADQESQYEPDGKHLKLFRVEHPGQPNSKKTYLGPMPIEMPDFAIRNAGWLCHDYYLLGYKQGRRDEGRFRRKKSSHR
ncbi:hypothetical protein G9Q84_08960 [Pseudomonas sp. P7]|uniref:hypothetical protein n=1 Tax=Pseudomonas TaxID=286 RepID=UPI0015ECC4EC|nr:MULTISPECIES: hypothetical protein [Pseudomonas]MBA2923020.1 hypothetical protein [Pseudomonas sivasensis]MCF5141193.1 hypothetical protein [Pseudomonas sp. PA-6-3C]MCF5149746.1 hypothetical protein [Pseudomonas sp. PA-6-3F]MCF5157944.1 hypothetical protein [Pseudomonas sp. PA-6-2E]MCF5174184.1 hypothetical protein [Pseudomonas sp. PA-6-1D]